MKNFIYAICQIVKYLGLPLLGIAAATWGLARLCRLIGIWGIIIPTVFAVLAIIELLITIAMIYAAGN